MVLVGVSNILTSLSLSSLLSGVIWATLGDYKLAVERWLLNSTISKFQSVKLLFTSFDAL